MGKRIRLLGFILCCGIAFFPRLLKRCLAAVACLNPVPTDILMIDNSKGDRRPKELRESSAPVTSSNPSSD
jgi:hypothetical protein